MRATHGLPRKATLAAEKSKTQIADVFIQAATEGSNFLDQKIPWQLPAIPETITNAYQQALSLTNRYRIASG